MVGGTEDMAMVSEPVGLAAAPAAAALPAAGLAAGAPDPPAGLALPGLSAGLDGAAVVPPQAASSACARTAALAPRNWRLVSLTLSASYLRCYIAAWLMLQDCLLLDHRVFEEVGVGAAVQLERVPEHEIAEVALAQPAALDQLERLRQHFGHHGHVVVGD